MTAPRPLSPADASRVSLYVRIARVLRGRIQGGQMQAGDRLPAIPHLCDEFQASRNTVRQALALLSQEGSIASARGSVAVVRDHSSAPGTNPLLVRAINEPLAATPGLTIQLLRRDIVARPPPDLVGQGETPYPSYVRLLKVHSVNGQPYVLADFYVAQAVAAAFDPGAEGHVKIDRLLLEQRAVRIGSKRQVITGGHADAEVARTLRCEIGEAVILVRRWWRSPRDRLVCAAVSSYLAHEFVFETQESDPYRSMAKVGLPPRRARRPVPRPPRRDPVQLIEIDGKHLLGKHGLAIPRGILLASGDAAPSFGGRAVVKAQLLQGKRGKAGLVRRCGAADVAATAAAIREAAGWAEMPLLVEEEVDVLHEFYVAIRVDSARQVPVLLFSTRGGIDVEDEPGAVVHHPVDPLRGLRPHHLLPVLREAGVPGAQLGALARYLARLYDVFVTEDATDIEVNPLALSKGGALVALDAKIELDDAAGYRHRDRVALRSASIRPHGQTEREAQAAAHGVVFVELPGRIALLTSGAGLGMAVVDQLADAGFAPANFVDAPAGIGLEWKIDVVFDRARDPEVEAIAVYILQTAQPLARTVERLLAVLADDPPGKPVVVGLVASAGAERGLTLEQARARLAVHGIRAVAEISELVEALGRVVPPIAVPEKETAVRQ